MEEPFLGSNRYGVPDEEVVLHPPKKPNIVNSPVYMADSQNFVVNDVESMQLNPQFEDSPARDALNVIQVKTAVADLCPLPMAQSVIKHDNNIDGYPKLGALLRNDGSRANVHFSHADFVMQTLPLGSEAVRAAVFNSEVQRSLTEALGDKKKVNALCRHKLFTVQVLIGNKTYLVLIDGGATHSIISSDIQDDITQLFPRSRKPLAKVSGFDKSKTHLAYRIDNVKFQLDGVELEQSFLTAPVSSYDIILGKDFLHDFDVLNRYKTGEMSFLAKGKRHVLQCTDQQENVVKAIHALRFAELAHENPPYESK